MMASRNLFRAVSLCVFSFVIIVTGFAQTALTIESMRLLTQESGWIVTGNELLWTDNGGKNWSNIGPATDGTSRIDAVFFVDQSRGWVLVHGNDGNFDSLRLMSTHDRGGKWSLQPLRVLGLEGWKRYSGYASVYFSDVLHGWIALRQASSSNFSTGVLLATTDGGSNWSRLPDPPIVDALYFATPMDGWIAGGPAGDELYVTHDGGKTWNTTAVPLPSDAYRSYRPLYDLPQSTGVGNWILPVTFVGPTNSLFVTYTTSDQGRNWKLRDVESGIPVRHKVASSVLSDSNIVKAFASKGRLTLSSDSLASSIPVKVVPSSAIRQIDFKTRVKGWVLMMSGTCTSPKRDCRTTTTLNSTDDGGSTFTNITPVTANATLEALTSSLPDAKTTSAAAAAQSADITPNFVPGPGNVTITVTRSAFLYQA